MSTRILTGVTELDNVLRQLQGPAANRIAKAALRAGIRAVAKGIYAAAPLGKTGRLRASIGSRLMTYGRQGMVNAKAGIDVGKTSATRMTYHAPHGHLVALGTKPRWRKRLGGKFAFMLSPTSKQLRTGEGPPNDFVRRGYAASYPAVLANMHLAAKKQMAKEAAKLAKQ
jgi:hypothetical protein